MTDKNKTILLIVLIAVAAVVWYFNSQNSSVVTGGSAVTASSYKPLAVENPELQRSKLDASRKTEYKTGGRDLFSELAPPPPVDLAAKKEEKRAPQGPVIPPPPPPPELPATMKFFGYGTVPNGTARRAFLTDGDQIFIVAEGDTLLGKFRVVKIGNANLDFEEIATGRHGSTNLSEEIPAPPS
jgi:hypothetical protein